MKSTNYSAKVMDHFRNPRNTGTLKGDDVAMGRVGNPVCGDLMDIYIKVKDNVIKDIKFQTFGCGSAVATSSMITEMVKEKTLDEAYKVTRKDVAEELDGLPAIKMHCSNLAADALRAAIDNYRKGERVGDEGPAPPNVVSTSCKAPEFPEEIKGIDKYKGKGVFLDADNPDKFKDLRTLVIDKGDESIKTALDLTKETERVVFITRNDQIVTDNADLKKQILRSPVKILYLSKVTEILGEGEVEKVAIHDLDEDDNYELFIDAVLLL